MSELQLLRERMSELSNDLASIARVLQAFGHNVQAETTPTKHGRMVMFYKSELQTYVLQEMAELGKPISTRELALGMLAKEGKDGFDHRLTLDLIKRLGKSLQVGKRRGVVIGGRSPDGRYLWRLAPSKAEMETRRQVP